MTPDVLTSPNRTSAGRSGPVVGDFLFRLVCRACAWTVIGIALSLVVVLAVESWPFFRTAGFELLRVVPWNPGGARPSYGGLALIYGTLATSAIAMLLAVPLGVGTAAFLAEMAPGRLRTGGAFLVELLAAIPSVVYGLWGLQVFAPLVGGPGIFPAGLILAVMIVPYITAVSYDVCRTVPQAQREGALALGATRWQMIRTAVLPYARSGIIAACFLALGRALGETMAVTMIIGNKAVAIESPVGGVGDSIASVVANQLNEATTDLQRSGLMGLGLLLLLVTVVLNVLARVFVGRIGRTKARRLSPLFRLCGRGAGGEGAVGLPSPPGPLSHKGRGGATAALTPSPSPAKPGEVRTVSQLGNRMMTGVLALSFAITLAPLFLVLGFILVRGLPGLSWSFFTELPQPPGEGGGLSNAIVGSCLIVGLATVGAVPIGILAGIFLAEYRTSRMVPVVRFVGEILGGVPSVIIGIYAYALWVGWRHFSALAGAFALGVMTIPIVLRTTEEALRLVPAALRNASHALGASHWQTIVRVTLPAALPAVITGVILAIARIAGETAPLLLTAYGSSFFPRSFDDRTLFLTKSIYDYARSGYPDWERQAWAASLVLVAVVMVLNLGIRFVTGKRTINAMRAD